MKEAKLADRQCQRTSQSKQSFLVITRTTDRRTTNVCAAVIARRMLFLLPQQHRNYLVMLQQMTLQDARFYHRSCWRVAE